MNWIPSIFRRRRLFDELSEEMRLHLEERVEQLMREGMSRAGGRAAGAHRVWQSGAGGGAQPGSMAVADAGVDRVRRPTRDAAAAAFSGIYHRRGSDSGAGHWRQRCGLQHSERVSSASAERGASRRASTNSSMETRPHRTSRIPTISICAIATAASTA